MTLASRRLIAHLVVVAGLWLFAVCGSSAAVVTVDAVAKTAVSDVATLEPKGVKVLGEQVGLLIQSTTAEQRELVVSVKGLKEQDYDIYINGSYTGAKPSAQIERGLELSIPGSVVDPDQLRCLEMVKPLVEAEVDRLQPNKDPEAQRVWYTLSQAADWTRSGVRSDASYRSVRVVVSPAGRALQSMPFPARLSDVETARAVSRACWLLQQARDRMYRAIKDPILRNSAVCAMTPVSLTARYLVKEDKPYVESTLLNNCDLPTGGGLTVAVPKGWKISAKNLSFQGLKPGRAFKTSFALLPLSKGAAVPASVRLAANVKVTQEGLQAQLKLETAAGR